MIEVVYHIDIVVHVDAPVLLQDEETQYIGLQPEVLYIRSTVGPSQPVMHKSSLHIDAFLRRNT